MTGQSHRFRTQRPAFAGLAALFCFVVWMLPAAADAGEDSVAEYQLLSRVTAQLLVDGTVEIRIDDSEPPLLTVTWPLVEGRRRPGDSSCHFTFTEGARGGLRGFARAADDDGDGLMDEDWADGRDNDGDGKIDEDFAAIGEFMGVVDLSRAGRRLHLESYHWTYSHLHSTVFLSGRCGEAGKDLLDSSARVTIAGGSWSRMTPAVGTAARNNPEVDFGQTFISSVPDPRSPGESIWLGLSLHGGTVLGEASDHLVQRSESLLEIPLLDNEMGLTITLAPTPLQLRSNLITAHAVHRGADGPEGRGPIPWIVPPLCQICRGEETPALSLREAGSGRLDLVVTLKSGDNGYIDPDRFRLNKIALGSPERISWEPASGQGGFRKNWAQHGPKDAAGLGVTGLDPYADWSAVRTHTAAGRLVFSFSGRIPAPDPREGSPVLEGGWLTGRSFSILLEGETGETEAGTAQADAVLRTIGGGRPPSLAPDLLMNYPNPFKNQTRIRVKVPQTIGEGLVWESSEQPNLDPKSPMPWAAGQPSSSIKIYTVLGQEILTIYNGTLTPGSQYEYSWNGEDVFGRPVASGTYFCKLQIEGWSVTKQVVYLR